MNTDLKLLALYDKIEKQIEAVKVEVSQVSKLEGPSGPEGRMGPKGDKGERGLDGANGTDGANGVNGIDGQDGEDGVSIVDVELDFDNHLRCTLSDGTVLDAGAIEIPEGMGAEVIQNYISTVSSSTQGDAVYIQDTQPTVSGKYLWIDTTGNDITFWVEDGT